MGNLEASYRIDEQLQAILADTGYCAGIVPQEQVDWLSANFHRVIRLVDNPVQGERLRKIMAGFGLPPIK
jgi:hypothetical protein